ncbi:hypothetical protein [Jiella marina]|uniref:hypothetical protein n=1 Tax=Jiella sp. LLJ827 TaxID=2917712 RepID=UPI002100DF57|nr:hypothetical protein [Jiella sp. LLJ827]MCQ0986599.1 hypothetical protein [Jiella sp. LLJ827]
MPKHYPLPRRFNAALSEAAYDRLRALNEKWSLSNNYLLTVLLENLDSLADAEKLDAAFAEFVETYGAPNGGMTARSG